MKKIRIITVGTKILCVVALVTNICIGYLIFTNIQSSNTIERTVDDVLAIRQNLSENLRETVVDLQNDFLELPAFFASNPQQKIIEQIEQKYTVTDKIRYEGRSEYKSLFTRKQRRDISKGKVIVTADDNKIAVSYSVPGIDRQFTDTVVRYSLAVDNPAEAAEHIQQLIEEIELQESGENVLQTKVAQLGNMVAEAGLEAETTRMEILKHVENITAMEHLLDEIRAEQRRSTVAMGAIVITINLFLLFFLIRHIVEKPLTSLTQAIHTIQHGEFCEVPHLKRRDQIGILSNAVVSFRQALYDIQKESLRKSREKEIIDEVFNTTTHMIHDLDNRAGELLEMSENMQNIAEETGEKAENVSRSAKDTAQYTEQVAQLATRLREDLSDIYTQILDQSRLVEKVVEKNSASHINIRELDIAVGEIDSIIAMVREITEQTHLLALNATIEATRAGDTGKGFAVVAREMKELSTRTGQAANEVLVKVGAINEASTALTKNFGEIEQHLSQLDTATSRISDSVSSQQSGVIIIAELADKTSTNTNTVSTTIEEVSHAAVETLGISRRVHGCSNDMARKLKTLLNQTTSKLRLIQSQSSSDSPEASNLLPDSTIEEHRRAA